MSLSEVKLLTRLTSDTSWFLELACTYVSHDSKARLAASRCSSIGVYAFQRRSGSASHGPMSHSSRSACLRSNMTFFLPSTPLHWASDTIQCRLQSLMSRTWWVGWEIVIGPRHGQHGLVKPHVWPLILFVNRPPNRWVEKIRKVEKSSTLGYIVFCWLGFIFASKHALRGMSKCQQLTFFECLLWHGKCRSCGHSSRSWCSTAFVGVHNVHIFFPCAMHTWLLGEQNEPSDYENNWRYKWLMD